MISRSVLCLIFLIVIGVSFAAEFCPLAPAVPQDRRPNPYKLRVASFNVEWLFLASPKGNSSGLEEFAKCPGTGCTWKNSEEALEHLKTIARIIDNFNADIVALQEVEDCYVLTQLILLIPFKGYKPYMLKGTDTATGQNVGIITKVDPIQNLQRSNEYVIYPLSGNKCGYTGASGNQGVSKHFFTRFYLSVVDRIIFMAGLHLLAIPTASDRCAKREAQATVLKNLIIQNTSPIDDIIVLGDFNDYASNILDIAGNVPTSRVLNIVSESRNLYNAASSVATDRSILYSNWYDRNNVCVVRNSDLSLIDHILISEGLKLSMSEFSFDHSFRAQCNSFASDHWPILVEFNFS
eukprot:TRINITY_DN1162_c0_g1_i1.p1 TRINITY_DN1162_c0_g1~~TRINITY_DN1162_c0_g1_i1.p1  ORF type:complete len:351 (-),score=31.51 TRINITY_DN1162_c0_g1_i1:43-1095(-)